MSKPIVARVSVSIVLVAVLVAALPALAQTGNYSEVVWEETWLPGSLACGQRVTARVTMRNIGTTVWTKDVYKLGPVEDSDELNGPGRVLIESDEIDVVRPGEQFTFEFELEAPGNNSLRWTDWQMVHEGVEWFGEVAGQQVGVSCAVPVDGAQVVGFDLPRSVECGQTYQASVTMRNTGTTTWSEEGLYRLGPVGDQDDLNGPGRVLIGGGQVPPGGVYTFHFELRAPEQASAVLLTDWQMVHDNVAWFGDTAGSLVNFQCQQPVDNAEIVSADLPAWLNCNQSYPASFTVRNTGTTTWTADVYRLGAVNDSDDLEGPVRVYLPSDKVVPPGGEHTFTFELHALGAWEEPALTDWRMVREGVAWFGKMAERPVVVDCNVEPPPDFPVRPGLWPASEEEASGQDLDGDGMTQARELELARFFLPNIWMDVEERCWGPGGTVVRPGPRSPGRLVFRVRPHPRDASRIAITYALLFANDCGDGVAPMFQHHGDVEPFSITLEPGAGCPTGYAVHSIKTWAHEGTPFEYIQERNLWGRCTFGYSAEPLGKNDIVVSSEDKHGNYLTLAGCDRGAAFTDHCSFGFTMGDENAWVGFNAGEPDLRRHDDLGPLGFPGERIWGGQKFCGGLPRQDGCPGPVEEKMKDRFFAPIYAPTPTPTPDQFCSSMGGDVCSASESCPDGSVYLGPAVDCPACCRQVVWETPTPTPTPTPPTPTPTPAEPPPTPTPPPPPPPPTPTPTPVPPPPTPTPMPAGLTCANYTNMYPSKQQCLAAGWSVCELRNRGDGLGGTITCWKGF